MAEAPALPSSVAAALQWADNVLGSDASARIDSKTLLCAVLDCHPTRLYQAPEAPLTPTQAEHFAALIARRQQGEPVAYLTGSRGFWGLDLQVTAATLIPRPDTECLVELALKRLQAGQTVVDLGTGSGAIVLALASERPDVHWIGVDASPDALRVAQDNAQRLQLTSIQFQEGDWLSGFAPASIDGIVSNPPYLEADDPHLTQGDVRYEPRSALVSGKTGLEDIHTILRQAQYVLKPGGWILIEHGYQQAQRVQHLAAALGFTHIQTHWDFGGNPRVCSAQKPA